MPPHDPARSRPAGARLDVLAVVNPVAARYTTGGLRELLESALVARGLSHEVIETLPGPEGRSELEARIRAALRRGCRRVLVAGGDGTVSMAGAAIPRRNGHPPATALGIVPAGTANVLARELGIPMDGAAAIALALDGESTLELDAIRTEACLVFTQVGIGPDAVMIRLTSRKARNTRGRLAYLSTFLRRAVGRPSEVFELLVDGKLHTARSWQVVVANAGVAGTPPFTWGPGIDPTDGALDLCIYDVRSRLDHVRLAWRVLTGNHQRDLHTRYLRVFDSVEIRARRPLLVQGDGEIIGRTPITLRVARQALRVVVPRQLDDVPAVVGSPGDPASRPAQAAAAAAVVAQEATPSVAHDVDVMVAQHSRTWVLQGALRHPIAKWTAVDAALFLRINALPLGRVADTILLTLSRGMHYGEGWAAVALFLLVTDVHTGLRATVDAMIVLWLTMLTVNYPLKRFFRRPRPFAAFVNARVVGPRPRDFSLPSGHSAAAFAGAYLFGANAPGGSPLYYALASAVGFSRVYLGMHYPSDVLFGSLAGTLLAMAFRALVHRLLPELGR